MAVTTDEEEWDIWFVPYINQNWKALFIADNPIPKELEFPELWTWFDNLRLVEDQ